MHRERCPIIELFFLGTRRRRCVRRPARDNARDREQGGEQRGCLLASEAILATSGRGMLHQQPLQHRQVALVEDQHPRFAFDEPAQSRQELGVLVKLVRQRQLKLGVVAVVEHLRGKRRDVDHRRLKGDGTQVSQHLLIGQRHEPKIARVGRGSQRVDLDHHRVACSPAQARRRLPRNPKTSAPRASHV